MLSTYEHQYASTFHRYLYRQFNAVFVHVGTLVLALTNQTNQIKISLPRKGDYDYVYKVFCLKKLAKKIVKQNWRIKLANKIGSNKIGE
jgi:coproporphyrinogen III oxidase